VDRAGLHSWQSLAGSVVSAAMQALPMRQPTKRSCLQAPEPSQLSHVQESESEAQGKPETRLVQPSLSTSESQTWQEFAGFAVPPT